MAGPTCATACAGRTSLHFKDTGGPPIPRILIALLFLVALAAQAAPAWCGEVIPPKPVDRFTDYANVTSASAATEFNNTLRSYEQASSNVVLVVVFPTMQSDSDIADYCTRVAHAWKAGSRETSNGVVLFIFIRDHKMHIATGYGMEGALPDAICERIIADEIAPSFKQQDYEDGIRAGISGIIAAASGDYQPAAPVAHHKHDPAPASTGVLVWRWCFCIFFVVALLYILRFVIGTIIAIFANIVLAIFYHDRTKRTAGFARVLMWIETHAEVKSRTSSSSDVPAGSHRSSRSSRRRSGQSSYSSYSGSSSSSSFSNSDSSSSSDSFASGGDYGGGGASGSW
ncbi:MAG TPA: TPM domain-containing protein [Tepidisphaeraceae bacterium]|jgi:uncharacterized protein|nr:TPM domain-containing protein [Tepidisphaeraceae bacterium]